MVKGITRQVILVKSPDPRLFEEAIFIVKEEALAREGDRLYTVLRARGGSAPYPAENFGLFTHLLLSDPAFPAFLQREKRRFSQALAGKRAAGLPTGSEEAILARLEECSHGA